MRVVVSFVVVLIAGITLCLWLVFAWHDGPGPKVDNITYAPAEFRQQDLQSRLGDEIHTLRSGWEIATYAVSRPVGPHTDLSTLPREMIRSTWRQYHMVAVGGKLVVETREGLTVIEGTARQRSDMLELLVGQVVHDAELAAFFAGADQYVVVSVRNRT